MAKTMRFVCPSRKTDKKNSYKYNKLERSSKREFQNIRAYYIGR